MASLSEILLQSGRDQANAERDRGARAGALWQGVGNAIGNTVGQIAQYQADAPRRRMADLQLQSAERDAAAPEQAAAQDHAFAQLITSNPDPDPNDVINIYGPQRGMEIAKGLQAFKELKTKKVSDAKKNAGDLAVGFSQFGPELQRHLWPSIRQAAIEGGLGDETTIPAQADPKFLEGVIAWAHGTPPQKVGTKTVEVVNPDGSKTTKIVEDKPGQDFTSAPVPEKVTFGSMTPAMVGGKRTFVRTRSDGKIVDISGKEVDPSQIQQNPDAPKDQRLVQIMGPNGIPIWVHENEAVGKPAAQAPRAVTGAERQALSFYNRGRDAVQTLETPDASGISLEDRVAKSGLMKQAGLKYLPNVLKSDDQQAYTQAQRAFTEARLRKESGAAIPDSEFENDRQTYFAQPGDSPATITQKRQKRAKLLEGLGYSAGKAYEEFYGEPLKKNAPETQVPSGLVSKPPPDQSGNWKWDAQKNEWVKK